MMPTPILPSNNWSERGTSEQPGCFTVLFMCALSIGLLYLLWQFLKWVLLWII